MASVAALPRAAADEIRRRELGAFLRHRRERIAPEQIGLPPSRRRRTPGLRREEVALLAGVGVTWYTWLEQGRDIHASPQVLDAIARTLLFDAPERAHLFTLAGATDMRAPEDCASLSPATQLVLDRLEPFPSLAVNGRYDLLASNRAWASGFPQIDGVPPEDRNCLWLMFTHPQWRKTILDWEDTAARMVAQFRAAMAEHVAEPAWKDLVARLHRASPEFAEFWERHEVQPPESRVKRVRHPDVGLLKLEYTYLWLGQRIGTRIVTYTPADDETRKRLDRLQLLLDERAAAA
ncbi:MAG TPA: helix-turn-helix transcriptional regulator [Gaiellaceae bacterium]|nr:helix-turn-helix transcriptional regulator [Gaiellaceae bacterium]